MKYMSDRKHSIHEPTRNKLQINPLDFVKFRGSCPHQNRQECLSYLLGSFDVAAFGGIHANAVAFVNKWWNGHCYPILERGWFVYV